MNEPKKLTAALGLLFNLSFGYFVVLPDSDAFIEKSECSDRFVLDNGQTTSGKWRPRRQLGSLPDLSPQGVGPVDGEVRGDTFYGSYGLEVEVFWEPHDGLSCAIK